MQVAIALANSGLTVSVRNGGMRIAMGRIIGDRAVSCFIKDAAVRPEYQRMGAGKLVMDAIIETIKQTAPAGFHVCLELLSSEGRESFYEAFSFGKKPGHGMGHGMMALVVGEKPVRT